MSPFAVYVLLVVVVVLGLGVAAVLVDIPVLLVVGVVLLVLGGIVILSTSRQRSVKADSGPTTDQSAGQGRSPDSELSQNVRTK